MTISSVCALPLGVPPAEGVAVTVVAVEAVGVRLFVVPLEESGVLELTEDVAVGCTVEELAADGDFDVALFVVGVAVLVALLLGAVVVVELGVVALLLVVELGVIALLLGAVVVELEVVALVGLLVDDREGEVDAVVPVPVLLGRLAVVVLVVRVAEPEVLFVRGRPKPRYEVVRLCFVWTLGFL